MQKVLMMLQILYEELYFLRLLLVLPLIVAVYNVDCQVTDLLYFSLCLSHARQLHIKKETSFSQLEDKPTDRKSVV
jgi:hypothetical protein